MKEFKKGDKVVCSERGDGVVTDILQVLNYPVIASFKNVMELYTADGRRLKDNPITLRHAEPEQTNLPDLTKILKVGDKVLDITRGELTVHIVSNSRSLPIVCNPGHYSYTADGRSAPTDKLPALFPIDQPIPAPQWPTQPQTYEWEGETYEVGEWVAVRSSIGSFKIHQLDFVNHKHDYPINTECGWVWNEMRKLTSFNQPDQTSREEKEMAFNCYMNQEYDIALTPQQISEIFDLIEK